MPRLEEKMKRASEQAADRMPAEAMEVIERHTRELENSGLAEQAVGRGDTAPAFALPDAHGETVRLGDLTDQGPVVLNFYRGRW